MVLLDEYWKINVFGQTWADTLKIIESEGNWESNPYLPVNLLKMLMEKKREYKILSYKFCMWLYNNSSKRLRVTFCNIEMFIRLNSLKF